MSKVLLVCQCPVDIEKVKKYFKAKNCSSYSVDRARGNNLSGFYVSADGFCVYGADSYDVEHGFGSYKRVYNFNTDLGSI